MSNPQERASTQVDYPLLREQVVSLLEGEALWLPALANASAQLWETLPRINWVGFYLREDLLANPEDAARDAEPAQAAPGLVLGPFQGRVACTRIPRGRGVCGTAAQRDQTLVVPDVHQFVGHIACDSASRSEVVVPLHHAGRVVAVLDIDSPEPDRFSPEDAAGLEGVRDALEAAICWPQAAR